MNQKDLMKHWFKELPMEQPSPDFTVKVMQGVMAEWTLNPIKYRPMISKKGWWSLGIIAIVITSLLFLLQSSMPAGTGAADQAKSVLGLDITLLLQPVSQLFQKLNGISPAVAIGTFAIVALWFFDQLFTRTIKHQRNQPTI